MERRPLRAPYVRRPKRPPLHSVGGFVLGGQAADRIPQLRKQRLAGTRLELCRRHALERHHLVPDDAESQMHVGEPPLEKRLVVVHVRLKQPKQLMLTLRRALEVENAHSSPAEQLAKRRPEPLAGGQQPVEAGRLLTAPPPQ